MLSSFHRPNLFTYLDYRLFLKDWYRAAKASRASFSFRSFSAKAGFRSPNFFKLVMDGDRNLTESSLSKFSIGLSLNKQEHDFFRNLVFFNQAEDAKKKAYYYERLLQSRKFSELKPIAKDQYAFYSTWYHPVVRELIASPDFTGDPAWIADRLVPSLSVSQVEKSIELLEKLGFIQKTPDGKWAQSTPLVSTGAESAHLALMTYHQSVLDLAKTVLPKTPHHARDVSVLTLGIAKKRLPELKEKIQQFRKDLLQWVSTDVSPEDVVMLGMQLLPMTRALLALSK